MRYIGRMKNSLRGEIAFCSVLALGLLGFAGCDKADSASEKTPSAEIAAVPTATPTATAKAEAEAGEASCAGADKESHAGADCMKKSAEAGEAMGCNKWDKAAAAIGKQEIPENASWQVLKVEGMTCGGCERRIIANLGKLEGVVAVEADSELGQVRVAVASGNSKASSAASAKISELGYTVQ
jgi:copper chaperone CopZ